MGIDFGRVVGIVAQSVKDLRQGEVRQIEGNFFGRDARAPQLHNCPDGGARCLNHWFAGQDFRRRDDVSVGGMGHCVCRIPS